jgi:hypothetical protein
MKTNTTAKIARKIMLPVPPNALGTRPDVRSCAANSFTAWGSTGSTSGLGSNGVTFAGALIG